MYIQLYTGLHKYTQVYKVYTDLHKVYASIYNNAREYTCTMKLWYTQYTWINIYKGKFSQ